MLDSVTVYINEELYAEAVSGIEMDRLLANGWRHFGTRFFRYNFGGYGMQIHQVIPLRIRLAFFHFLKANAVFYERMRI